MRPTNDAYHEARTLLSNHGVVRPQSDRDWTGTIPLPPDLALYYQHIGPVDVSIPGYGNPTELPSLARLWQYQAGYRWNGITGEASAGWSDNWVVIASEGGNPYILDRQSGAVLFARHGGGSWQPEKCFPNLAIMASCLATLGSIRRTAGKNFLDKNFFVLQTHREAALAAVAKITGSPIAAARVVRRAGWGEPRAA